MRTLLQARPSTTREIPTWILTRAYKKNIESSSQIRTRINPSPRVTTNRQSYSTVKYHGQCPHSDYVFDEQQVFGSEVKVNPSQSEANVAADRGEIDPLPMGMHNTILLEAGEAARWSHPTDSEEAVHAERCMNDPLRSNAGRGYC